MIVYKVWHGWEPDRKDRILKKKVRWEGWFLFGIIPIYVRQCSYIQRDNP